MEILNLYAGIGGNRKLWGDEHNVTAVEYREDIADVYRHYAPKDTVIVSDAHQYLLDNYKRFDFIWSSPLAKLTAEPGCGDLRIAIRLKQNTPI